MSGTPPVLDKDLLEREMDDLRNELEGSSSKLLKAN